MSWSQTIYILVVACRALLQKCSCQVCSLLEVSVMTLSPTLVICQGEGGEGCAMPPVDLGQLSASGKGNWPLSSFSSRLSFYSGHSSFSMYCMLFVAVSTPCWFPVGYVLRAAGCRASMLPAVWPPPTSSWAGLLLAAVRLREGTPCVCHSQVQLWRRTGPSGEAVDRHTCGAGGELGTFRTVGGLAWWSRCFLPVVET